MAEINRLFSSESKANGETIECWETDVPLGRLKRFFFPVCLIKPSLLGLNKSRYCVVCIGFCVLQRVICFGKVTKPDNVGQICPNGEVVYWKTVIDKLSFNFSAILFSATKNHRSLITNTCLVQTYVQYNQKHETLDLNITFQEPNKNWMVFLLWVYRNHQKRKV